MVEVQKRHFFYWEHGEESLEKLLNKLKFSINNKIYC